MTASGDAHTPWALREPSESSPTDRAGIAITWAAPARGRPVPVIVKRRRLRQGDGDAAAAAGAAGQAAADAQDRPPRVFTLGPADRHPVAASVSGFVAADDQPAPTPNPPPTASTPPRRRRPRRQDRAPGQVHRIVFEAAAAEPQAEASADAPADALLGPAAGRDYQDILQALDRLRALVATALSARDFKIL